MIDTDKAASAFRGRVLNLSERKFLISRLAGSGQEPDLTSPTNCEGLGRIRHFKQETSPGWPINPLPIVPACNALGIPSTEMMLAQVFQIAACPWRCWYCFVPYDLLKGDVSRSQWISCSDLVALYEKEKDPPLIIDLSGGSPDLVPEWTVWMMQALLDANLSDKTYLWTDDNLSTDYLFSSLSKSDLDTLTSYRNYGRVCCFKGYDNDSFVFNTHAREDGFDKQFEIMRRTLDLGLDTYGYVTLTSWTDVHLASRMSIFFDRLQGLDPHLPLRIVPLKIQQFGPVKSRMTEDRVRSFAIQEQAIEAWNYEINKRFDGELRGKQISSVPLQTSSGSP